MGTVDITQRERKALILHPLVKEVYKSDDSKYRKFIEKLNNTFCELGGHKNCEAR